MSTYVSTLVVEASGERRWGEAKLRAAETWKAELALRRAISEEDDSDADG
jgi:hypothetical protein